MRGGLHGGGSLGLSDLEQAVGAPPSTLFQRHLRAVSLYHLVLLGAAWPPPHGTVGAESARKSLLWRGLWAGGLGRVWRIGVHPDWHQERGPLIGVDHVMRGCNG